MSRLALLILAALLLPVPAAALQRSVPDLTRRPEGQTPAPSGCVVVKFREGTGLRMTAAGLTGGAGKAAGAAARLDALLTREAPGAKLARHFSLGVDELDALRRRAEARSGLHLPDPNLYARIVRPAGDRAALLRLVAALAADPAVETAFLEPIAVPAALGFDAFTGVAPAADARPAGILPGKVAAPATTPDFSPLQGYLAAAPDGVDVGAVAAVPGSAGDGIKLIDVEGAWLWSHEDLPAPHVALGTPVDELSWRNHGTAVLGEIRGTDNGLGVRGIAPACAVGGSSVGDQATAGAILSAAAALDPGDVIVIELHAPGPNATGSGQYGYLPMEYWQDNFDAMLLATAAGLIVCEAAGNGEQNLDDPLYEDLFDRQVRDSGAVMCGASAGSDLSPAWFTNFGGRVDLHGWGSGVTTCAYGSLQGNPEYPEEQWYTDGFSGTSSATPIVAGAVVSLQGMVRTAFGIPLDARLARDLLVQTGTPQGGKLVHIGPRPDLGVAWALAAAGVGGVAGTVYDVEDGLPLPDVRVVVAQTGAFDVSAADGGYGFSLVPGGYDLTFSSFFFQSATVPVGVTGGATTPLDVTLVRRPTVDLTGRVRTPGGAPLAGVRVTPLTAPLPADATDAGGDWRIPGAPAGETYRLLFDGVPGFGVEYRELDSAGATGGEVPLYLSLPPAGTDFELDTGGFLADSLWSWGTPAAGGPTGGFSGDKCWGIGMGGDYPDDAIAVLYSTVEDFGYTPIEHLLLSFHYWCDTEPGFDGVQLQVNGGAGFATRTPLGDYTDSYLSGLAAAPGELVPGWSGDSGGWRGAVFDLSDLIGGTVGFRLVFGSDGGVNGAGFWIDDVCWDTGGDLSAAPGDDGPPAARGPSLAAFPNPFNPRTTVAWRVTAPGPLRVALYDLRGRLVRTLLDGPVRETAGTVTWNGRDGDGRRTASGVYLVRLRDARGAVAGLRISLVQ